MRLSKTTKNMMERRGMTICVTDRGSVVKDNGVPRDLVAIMLTLNGKHDVRTTNVEDAMVFYSVLTDGSLQFEVGTSICDETMFPISISTEGELRASLDAIRKSLNSVVKTVEVPKWAIPEVVEPVVEPVVVGSGDSPESFAQFVSVGDDYIPESQVLPHLADIVEDTLSDLLEHSPVKTVLASVLMLLRSPVPTVHTFPAEPALGTMIVETDFDFSLEFRNDVYCGRFILRDVTRTELHQLHVMAIELVKDYKAYELLQALSVIVSVPERSRNGAITGNRGVEWFSYNDN